MSKVKIAVLALLTLALLVHSVYSNPKTVGWSWELTPTGYVVGVIVGEALGWIIGAKVLHMLLGGQKRKVYLAMLVSMLVSFFVGNIIWLLIGVE